jgi:hypothetical protein
MRLLTLIFVAWMCAAVNASAHQSGAKHCENLNADTHSNECLGERRISSKGSMTLAFDEIDNDDSGDVLSASLDSIDHVACGERTGHLKLVFICSKGTTKVFVTGTCRFADHARFGQLYFKIGDKRRKKVEAYVHDGGNALGISDQKKCVPYHQHDYCGRAGHNSGAAVSLVANKRDIRSGSI